MKGLCAVILSLAAAGLSALGPLSPCAAPQTAHTLPVSSPQTLPCPAPGAGTQAPLPSGSEDQAPRPPSLSELRTLLGPAYVQVVCAASRTDHPPGQYGIPGPASYALGDVSGDAAGYTVTLTLFGHAYAEAFGVDTRSPHVPEDDQADASVILLYDPAQGRWTLREPAGRIVFSARCSGEACVCGRPSVSPAEARRLRASPEGAAALPEDFLVHDTPPLSLIFTGLGLLTAAAGAAYLGRRSKDSPD